MFSGIIGQSKAVRLLTRALSGGRLAHAYLFIGPDGVGKTTTARQMAALLFCTGSDPRPCGRCRGCVKFSSGNHPDFLLIEPDGTAIKIDQVRKLKKSLPFAPFEAERRIVLMLEVQAMRREAANSLLKILEEPPDNTLFLLVASESEPILDTIRSRCQIIPFYPLTANQAAEVLMRNEDGLTSNEAMKLAVLTDGCPGRSSVAAGRDLLALAEEILGAILQTGRSEAEAVEEVLFQAARMADVQDDLPFVLDLFQDFFKDVLRETLTGTLDGGTEGIGSRWRAAARERWNLQELSDKIQSVLFARKALNRNCNRALVCEVLLLELMKTARPPSHGPGESGTALPRIPGEGGIPSRTVKAAREP